MFTARYGLGLQMREIRFRPDRVNLYYLLQHDSTLNGPDQAK